MEEDKMTMEMLEGVMKQLREDMSKPIRNDCPLLVHPHWVNAVVAAGFPREKIVVADYIKNIVTQPNSKNTSNTA